MKRFTLIFSFFVAATNLARAQNPVTDTHPEASIFAINYQTGQEAPATGDAAILFKDALIDLVLNTNSARMHLVKAVPGRKSMVIMQVDPKNSNGYQLTLQSKFLGQTSTIYSFLYNIDQNTLYYYDLNMQNWVPETIQGNNMNNLNNCVAYGKFNNPQPQGQAPDLSVNNSLQSADAVTDTTPIDTAVSANTIPPALPDYEQPECPQDGYLWQPGYWAYSPYHGNYYWVPGAWVAPPSPGLLWTPPYWGFFGGRYVFHMGYWGPTIGFYGGINYGYGYQGRGYVGGEWHEGHFRYNTAVVRVNTVYVHNTFVNTTVIDRTVVNNHTSFNGTGGVMARPTPREMQAMHEHHVMATPEQIRNQQIARSDKSQFASPGGGRPANMAASHVPDRPVTPAPANNVRPAGPGATNTVRTNSPVTNTPSVPGGGRTNTPVANVPPVPAGMPKPGANQPGNGSRMKQQPKQQPKKQNEKKP